MLPEHYIAKQIADASTLSVNEAIDNAQVAYQGEPVQKLTEDIPGWNPAAVSVPQGQKAIVANVKSQEVEKARQEEATRFARAVADAMKPNVEVGSIDSEGKVVGVKLEPVTLPESKATIQAGIKAVGAGGRKGVFSELPFDAEDVPAGWDVMQTEDGGWLASPKENTDEVLANEREGARHKTLGYVAEKKESDDRVVQVRDSNNTVVQDVSTDAQGESAAVAQALDIAGHIDGTYDVVKPEAALAERETAATVEVAEDIFNSFSTVEGYRPKVYKDSQGLRTVGVGFNMEQDGAKGIWRAAGVKESFDDVYNGSTQLGDEDIKRLLAVTIKDSEQKAMSRAKDLGVDWNGLPNWHKAILTDIAFNTGKVSGWTKVFKNTNRMNVLREARRTEGGKNTVGMDNRVARIGLELGIIKSVAQARQLGLTLTDLKDSEVNELISKRAKAQPTIGVAG